MFATVADPIFTWSANLKKSKMETDGKGTKEEILSRLDYPLMIFFNLLVSNQDINLFLTHLLKPLLDVLDSWTLTEGIVQTGSQGENENEAKMLELVALGDMILGNLVSDHEEVPVVLRKFLRYAQDHFLSAGVVRSAQLYFFRIILGVCVTTPHLLGCRDSILTPSQRRHTHFLALLFDSLSVDHIEGNDFISQGIEEDMSPIVLRFIEEFRERHLEKVRLFCEVLIDPDDIADIIKRTSVRFAVTPRLDRVAVDNFFAFLRETLLINHFNLFLEAIPLTSEGNLKPNFNALATSPSFGRTRPSRSHSSAIHLSRLSSPFASSTLSQITPDTSSLPRPIPTKSQSPCVRRTSNRVPELFTTSSASSTSSSTLQVDASPTSTGTSPRTSFSLSILNPQRTGSERKKNLAGRSHSRPLSEMKVEEHTIFKHSDGISPRLLTRNQSDRASSTLLPYDKGASSPSPVIVQKKASLNARNRSRTACSPPPMRKTGTENKRSGLSGSPIGAAPSPIQSEGGGGGGGDNTNKEYKFFFATKIKPLKDIWPSRLPDRLEWPKDTLVPGNWRGMERDLAPACVCEWGTSETIISSESEFEIEYVEKLTTRFFRDHLMKEKHWTYVAMDENLGPVVCSVEDPNKIHDDKVKLIVRTKEGDKRMFAFNPVGAKQQNRFTSRTLSGAVPGKIMKKDHCHKIITSSVPELDNTKLYRIDDLSLGEKLVKFEYENCIIDSFKFGVLLCRKGQSVEDEWYGNQGTPEFFHFMDFLGTKIALRNWHNFRGGLNIKNDMTGTHSYYVEHRGFEIMFHVAPMLPYFPDDSQQLERKRHLGNDVVLLLYLEEGVEIDVSVIASQFNHVFCLVQKNVEKSTDALTQYNVMFSYKKEVIPFTPFLPKNWTMPRNQLGKEFILTKLINGEGAAMFAPVFQQKSRRTRDVLLRDLVDTFMPKDQKK